MGEEIHYKHSPEEPLVLFPSHLLEKRNQYLYQGNENFRYVESSVKFNPFETHKDMNKRTNLFHNFSNYFREIVAGGGTGGATVFSGEQFNHTNQWDTTTFKPISLLI